MKPPALGPPLPPPDVLFLSLVSGVDAISTMLGKTGGPKMNGQERRDAETARSFLRLLLAAMLDNPALMAAVRQSNSFPHLAEAWPTVVDAAVAGRAKHRAETSPLF